MEYFDDFTKHLEFAIIERTIKIMVNYSCEMQLHNIM